MHKYSLNPVPQPEKQCFFASCKSAGSANVCALQNKADLYKKHTVDCYKIDLQKAKNIQSGFRKIRT